MSVSGFSDVVHNDTDHPLLGDVINDELTFMPCVVQSVVSATSDVTVGARSSVE